MITIAINGIGVLLIVLLIWWFWLKHPIPVTLEPHTIVDILVKDGTYQPAYIEVRAGEPFILRFTREDTSPCADVVVFPTLHRNQQLSFNQAVDIDLIIETPGEYPFTCQMGMYRGKLIAIK